MIRARSLVLLTALAAVVACNDNPVEPTTSPETAAGLGLIAGVADQTAFQDALDDAATSSNPSTIALDPGVTIALTSPLTYDGEGTLTIQGRGATLVGPDGGSAFVATGGGDLNIDDLAIEEAGEHAIYVEVPTGRSGTFKVAVDNVTLADNGFAGLWVDDQVNDTDASVQVTVSRSTITGNNTAGVGDGTDLAALADKDGVRVNEGGAGDLTVVVSASWFEDNQADGLELDEIGPGDAYLTVSRASFIDNGKQEQFPEDLEDGADVDEAGDGSIYAHFTDVYVTGHLDEGIDLDELDAGSIFVSMTNVASLANADDNVSLTESEDDEGEGDIQVNFRNVDFSESLAVEGEDEPDGDGLKIEEFGAGDVTGKITRSRIANNDDDGIQVDESGPGGGFLKIQSVIFEGNGDDDINSDVDFEVVGGN